MRNCLANKRFLDIFLLIFIAGFLILPNICPGEDFKEITLEQIEKYLTLPEIDAKRLIQTLIQTFTTETLELESSGTSIDAEMDVVTLLRGVSRGDISDYLLIDLPIEISKNILDVLVTYFTKGPGGLFEKFEKMTVNEAKQYLLQEQIRVAPGVIGLRYISHKGNLQETTLQYIIIYQPVTANRAKVVMRFYSPLSIESPKSKSSLGYMTGGLFNLQQIFPFIADLTGLVERGKLSEFYWIDEEGNRFYGSPSDLIPVKPKIKITFPESVPDLGIKPLTFWEKYVLKPIETQIKDIEVIITKVTGKSLNLVGILDKIKSFFSKINPPAPAALIETPLPEEEEPSIEVGQEIGQEIFPSVEVKPQ